MGKAIFIVGRSGSGKSHSMRNLDPKETLIINCDDKELPFRFKENYNKENKNYVETSNIKSIFATLKYANDNPNIKRIIIDTWSRIMTDTVMSKEFRQAVNGMKAWGEMSASMYDLFTFIKRELRDDIKVYLFAHLESYYNDVGLLAEKIVVQGE